MFIQLRCVVSNRRRCACHPASDRWQWLSCHERAEHIVDAVAQLLSRDLRSQDVVTLRKGPHDVPGDWFKGPF
jgi:hypothetical protein